MRLHLSAARLALGALAEASHSFWSRTLTMSSNWTSRHIDADVRAQWWSAFIYVPCIAFGRPQHSKLRRTASKQVKRKPLHSLQ